MRRAWILAIVLALAIPACEAFVPADIADGLAYLKQERQATSQQVNHLQGELAKLQAGKDVPWLSESDKALIDQALAEHSAELAAASARLEKLSALEPEVEEKSKEVAAAVIEEQLWTLAQYALSVLGIGVGGAFIGTRRRSAADKGRMLAAEIIDKVNEIRGPPKPDQSGGGSAAA